MEWNGMEWNGIEQNRIENIIQNEKIKTSTRLKCHVEQRIQPLQPASINSCQIFATNATFKHIKCFGPSVIRRQFTGPQFRSGQVSQRVPLVRYRELYLTEIRLPKITNNIKQVSLHLPFGHPARFFAFLLRQNFNLNVE